MAANLQVQNGLGATAQAVKDQTGHTSSLAFSIDAVGVGTTQPKTLLTVGTPKGAGVQEGTRINNPSGFVGNGHGSSLVFSQDRSPAEDMLMAAIECVQDIENSSERAYLAFRTRHGIGAANGVSEKLRISADANVSIVTIFGKCDVRGNIQVTGDIILPGADCAEYFDVEDAQALQPGTVMVVGKADKLCQSREAYDKRVAGVLSGAGDYRPGVILGQKQSQNDRLLLALTGKAFCNVDAQYSPIGVGDLLTTSPTLGYAMRADDPITAFGAVIGKALRPLPEGRGMIPILISLQ
jgi:hypothetical protein